MGCQVIVVFRMDCPIASSGKMYATAAMMQNDISKPFLSLFDIAMSPTPISR